MKGLIVYQSKTSSTKKCADILKKELNFDIKNIKEKDIDINKYDLIIIGSYIRMGMIDKNIKKFVNSNSERLLTKKCAYYLCCGNENNKEQYFSMNYPQSLMEKALVKETFGSQMDIDNLKGLDKFIVKAISKNPDNKMKNELNMDNIKKFISKIK